MDSQVIAARTTKRRASGEAISVILLAAAILVGGLAAAGALLVLASDMPATFRPAGRIGSLQSVTLANGQVYFGRLTAVKDDALVLSDVYEVVTSNEPNSQQRVARLVSRRIADWHGPLDMTIPDDKVMLVETVGPDSKVGKAIAEAAQGKAETGTPAPATASGDASGTAKP